MLTSLKDKNRQKGFTLVELMIVVAIIGILAAVAIPNFRNYQLKSKTTEAKVNLGAIKTSQESYLAENDDYLACATSPANVPGTGKVAWAGNAAFTALGFAPSGDVYYSYGVSNVAAAAATPPEFLITAEADLDGDGGAGAAAPVAATCANTAAMVALTVTAADADDSLFSMDNAGTYTDQHPGIW